MRVREPSPYKTALMSVNYGSDHADNAERRNEKHLMSQFYY